MEKNLKTMPYAQARVIINDENNISLRSYETIVATLINNEWLHINGLYSMTTRKHIKAFCKEYCGFDDFSLIKAIVENKMYNILTGEVIPLA